jgi:hypothetical protein
MSERKEFLTDILTGAIENGGHGWFMVHDYEWEADEPYAVIEENDGDESNGDGRTRVDHGVIRRGLRVIAGAELREITEGYDAGCSVLHNGKDGRRLFLSPQQRKEIMLADRTNGEDGDLDVVDYLAIIECGLFGAVTYA